MDKVFEFYQHNVLVLYVIHIIITFILAYITSKYLLKRFVEHGKKIDLLDKKRSDEIELRGKIFKFLFKFSLHKNNQKTVFVFFFLFNISIPFLGYLFTIWIVWYLLHVKYKQKAISTSALNLDEFSTTFLKVERIFGEGSMHDLLTSDYAPKSKKIKALSSLANNISPANLQIIRQTLSSTDDEIRMFGYAVINKAEKTINQKIDGYLEIISSESAKNDKKNEYLIANAAKELAFLYWDMVYTELSHESLKGNFLNSAVVYIEMAKVYFMGKIDAVAEDIMYHKINDDMEYIIDKEKMQIINMYSITSSLYMLMGRIYIQRGEYEQAKTEFTVAQELLPEQSTFILPYLAEVYYVTGKYNVVKAILSKAYGLELNATLHPIIDQWGDYDS